MNATIDLINGACHCGAVRFTARLTDGMRSARRLYLFVLSHARGHCSFRRSGRY
jgi:hypothetical protein